MPSVNRRLFVGGSVSALATLGFQPAFAAAQCVTGPYPAFTPNRLTVDCASRHNFSLFRAKPTYLGLTGVVSMTFVRGRWGEYPAGNLFLFPWLKKPGLALGTAYDWRSLMPVSATRSMAAGPIRGWTLPLDEYFLRYHLEAPLTAFIGFRVDVPFGLNDSRRAWFSNVARLPDGKGVGIAWTSSNLNHPWFGGSRWIPNDKTCGGAVWRKLIVEGLQQASSRLC
jgi:hypothetical protein